MANCHGSSTWELIYFWSSELQIWIPFTCLRVNLLDGGNIFVRLCSFSNFERSEWMTVTIRNLARIENFIAVRWIIFFFFYISFVVSLMIGKTAKRLKYICWLCEFRNNSPVFMKIVFHVESASLVCPRFKTMLICNNANNYSCTKWHN